MKCADCDHKYCEFCNAGDKYHKKAKSNAVTNFDRIKTLNIDEMAKFLVDITLNHYCNQDKCEEYNGDCVGCMKSLLQNTKVDCDRFVKFKIL